MPQDQDIPYFEGKARQCFRLASGCTDQEVTARLRQLGYEFVAKALMLADQRDYARRLVSTVRDR
jgi:hypothetical protein